MTDAIVISEYVDKNYSNFGVNKKNEIFRLLFEITKRDDCGLDEIVNAFDNNQLNFHALKKILIKKRFPALAKAKKDINVIFPKLDIDPYNEVNITKRLQIPEKIFIEKAVLKSDLVCRLKKIFSLSEFILIESYSKHIKNIQTSIPRYNRRAEEFYIVKGNFDQIKKCPCSPNTLSCGYKIVNLGCGCTYECVYCYLQEYVNFPGIIIPANIQDFFNSFRKNPQQIRFGSGEFTDSLLFDHITEFSPMIVDFFRKYPKTIFEFKTKSTNIDLLLKTKSSRNIVISWSVNPQNIIDHVEPYTPLLADRIQAAGQCLKAGYKIAFHFDPIFYYDHWEDDYEVLINEIFKNISKNNIAWISLGTFRMAIDLKKIVENRFPKNTILNEELIVGYDNKFRYHKEIRLNIYKKMKKSIRKFDKNILIYLCMEEKNIYSQCEITPFNRSPFKV